MFVDPTQVSAHPTQGTSLHTGDRPDDSVDLRFDPAAGAASDPSADDDFGAWGHEPHEHTWHLLIYVPLGHAVVWAHERSFHLTGTVALWVPAGVEHAARFDADALVTPVGFDTDLFRLAYTDCTEVVITERRRRMLLAHLRERLDDADPTLDLFEAMVEDATRVPLPMPQSTIAAAVAGVLLASPGDQRTVTEWAQALYTSPTSLRRAFLAETGLTFSEWRSRARVNASVDLLGEGRMVSTVAQQVGFSSTNGFILAFRRYFGVTPKVFASGQACA